MTLRAPDVIKYGAPTNIIEDYYIPFIDLDPPYRNENFSGRDSILDGIRNSLGSKSGRIPIYTLIGISGIGKTQIAIEYINRNREIYKYVWWLKSEEPAVLETQFMALGDVLNKEPDFPKRKFENSSEAISAIRSWLGKEHGWNWLMVFDNAGDVEAVREYLPSQGSGHIIITSLNSISPWESVAFREDLTEFSNHESIEFLLRRTRLEDKDGAGKLAEELGNFPLALEQAGAYIYNSGIRFANYLKLFQNDRKLLLDSNEPPDYAKTVARTWEISLVKICKSSTAAEDLLNLCAFLAPDDIPRSLIVEGAKHLPEPMSLTMINEIEFNRAIFALRRYSLIRAADNLISIHRLVQAVTRDRLNKDLQTKWATIAVNLVNDAFKFNSNDVNTWINCSCILEHALVTSGIAEQHEIALKPTRKLLTKTSLYLRETRRILNVQILA